LRHFRPFIEAIAEWRKRYGEMATAVDHGLKSWSAGGRADRTTRDY